MLSGNLDIKNHFSSIFTLINDISGVIFVICSHYICGYFAILVMILLIIFYQEKIRTYP